MPYIEEELFKLVREKAKELEDKFIMLRGVARFAIRVTRQTQPLDSSGRCLYCENLIAEAGKGEQELKPHGEQCMWELLRLTVEKYNEVHGALHDKQATVAENA
jgi:hypothetical protein